VISHASAAAAHGLPLLKIPNNPCITLPTQQHTSEAAVHVHRQPIERSQRQRHGSLNVTTVPRSCVDLTREHGLLAGIVAADAALHHRLMTPAELSAMYRKLAGRAGLRDGDALVRLSNGLSESPLESISRISMRPLPHQPELQITIRSIEGHFIARADFFWREFGLIGEADGFAKYDDAELRSEKRRQDALLRTGLVVTRWNWATAMNPPRLCDQVTQALAQAAGLRRAGVPFSAHAA
jgi:hypothetical protein